MAKKTQLERQLGRAAKKEARIGKKAVRKLGADTEENRELVKAKLANRKQRTKEFIRMGVGLPNADGVASKVETAKYNLAAEKKKKEKSKLDEAMEKSSKDAAKVLQEKSEPALFMKPVTHFIKRNT